MKVNPTSMKRPEVPGYLKPSSNCAFAAWLKREP
jgi:hypothetical protein